jgi:hypothetical protein
MQKWQKSAAENHWPIRSKIVTKLMFLKITEIMSDSTIVVHPLPTVLLSENLVNIHQLWSKTTKWKIPEINNSWI